MGSGKIVDSEVNCSMQFLNLTSDLPNFRQTSWCRRYDFLLGHVTIPLVSDMQLPAGESVVCYVDFQQFSSLSPNNSWILSKFMLL
jgi:hypothetical protein